MVDDSEGEPVNCIYAATGSHKKIKTYAAFKKFILSRAK